MIHTLLPWFSCPVVLLCNLMDFSTPGLRVSHHLPKFAPGHVHCTGDATQSFHPLMPSSSAVFPSIRDFSNESALLIRWPKYWSFSFSISPSKDYSGLISFKIGWLDLLAVQGTLRSLLQCHSSEESILQHSAFFTVQHSQPFIATGETTALTTPLSAE